jgi:thioredoxin 1
MTLRIFGAALLVGAAVLIIATGCPNKAEAPAANQPAVSQPAANEAVASQPAADQPAGDSIHWHTSFAEAQAAAQSGRKPMVVDFFATWCGPCKMLAEKSFPSSKVQALKDQFVWARIDVDQNGALAAKYQAGALPTVMVMDGAGRPIDHLVGFTDGDSLADFLAQALTKSRLLTPDAPPH